MYPSTHLSKEEAAAFCEQTERLFERDLDNLAYYVAQSGGPIGELDASVDSLVPLWRWFTAEALSGADVVPPGIPLTTNPDRRTTAGSDPDDVVTRGLVLVQGINAYVMLVCQRFDPGAHFEVFENTRGKRSTDSRLGLTCIRLTTGEWIDPLTFVMGVYGQLRSGALINGDDEAIRRLFLALASSAAPGAQERLSSVLEPRLGRITSLSDLAEENLFRPAPKVAEAIPPQSEPSGRPNLRENELILAYKNRSADGDIAANRAIDVGLVQALFTGLGIPLRNQPTVDQMLSTSTEFELEDTAQFSVDGLHGGVRELFVERTGADDEEWEGIVNRMERFALTIGAHFGPEGTWPE